jgi:hypothetical protein
VEVIELMTHNKAGHNRAMRWNHGFATRLCWQRYWALPLQNFFRVNRGDCGISQSFQHQIRHVADRTFCSIPVPIITKKQLHRAAFSGMWPRIWVCYLDVHELYQAQRIPHWCHSWFSASRSLRDEHDNDFTVASNNKKSDWAVSSPVL